MCVALGAWTVAGKGRLDNDGSSSMSKADLALWADMMTYLRSKHAPICRQWFEDLRPAGVDSGLIRVRASNEVQRNYLQKKCIEQFTEAAQIVTGRLMAVRFTSDGHEDLEASPIATNGHTTHGHAAHTRISSTEVIPAAPAASAAPARVTQPRPAPLAPAPARLDHIVISPDYSFEQFITGPENRLAHAAAVAVANAPGSAYNPLFIHGGVGLGKTHLLQAMYQRMVQERPGIRICYLPCDAFISDFVDCVQNGQMNEFRHRYRSVDVLMIDDIHFLADRERTQEEFFHTFNELHQSRRQIVLSSDSPPGEIPALEERLVSRFQWGLVASVSRPCYETRVAIVQAKSKLRGIDMPEDVVQYVAQHVDSNARELEGAIVTIQGHAALQNRVIDMALAQEALGNSAGSRTAQITLQNIIDVVTAYYNVKLSDLQSKRRHKSITMPRQVCMWLARRRTRFSLQEIGGYFGGRDHTTVMHSIKTVDDRMAADTEFAREMNQLDTRLVE